MTRFHQFVGNLMHYAQANQHFKPGRWRLPGPEADGELRVDNFIKAASAPPLPVRR